MIGRMNRGEDIEHYADKYEERQKALREYHESGGANPSGGFPEQDKRESRKIVAQQQNIY